MKNVFSSLPFCVIKNQLLRPTGNESHLPCYYKDCHIYSGRLFSSINILCIGWVYTVWINWVDNLETLTSPSVIISLVDKVTCPFRGTNNNITLYETMILEKFKEDV